MGKGLFRTIFCKAGELAWRVVNCFQLVFLFCSVVRELRAPQYNTTVIEESGWSWKTIFKSESFIYSKN